MFTLLKNALTTKTDPGELYNSLGDTYMLGEKADYFNFGYWPAKDYDQACQQLTFKLADYLQLEKNEHVLHAGCGFGQEMFDLTQHYPDLQSVGINLSTYQLKHANNKFKSTQTAFLQASAVTMPFKENSFDKVLALESAMHFASRQNFMEEAYRVLEPGGWIGCADILLSTSSLSLYWKLWLKLASKIMHVPLENFYDIQTYQQKLQTAGFVNIEYQDVTKPVLWGILRYLKKRNNYRSANITLAMKIVALLSMRRNSPVAYYLVRGMKATSS